MGKRSTDAALKTNKFGKTVYAKKSAAAKKNLKENKGMQAWIKALKEWRKETGNEGNLVFVKKGTAAYRRVKEIQKQLL
jgi:accessory colonization factor AcfC